MKGTLSEYPPFIFAGEARTLKENPCKNLAGVKLSYFKVEIVQRVSTILNLYH